MDATCLFETSVDFQQTRRPYISEDIIIHEQILIFSATV
jgi:hypothetical protein